jgi:hypothetical protein
MVTSIQLKEEVKEELKKYKKFPNSTYEDVIVDFIKGYKQEKENEFSLLKEAYLDTYKKTKEITSDWEFIDLEDLRDEN